MPYLPYTACDIQKLPCVSLFCGISAPTVTINSAHTGTGAYYQSDGTDGEFYVNGSQTLTGLTSIDNEGTGLSYDQELVQSIVNKVSIPVIVHGGAGKIDHCLDLAIILLGQQLLNKRIRPPSFLLLQGPRWINLVT